MAERVTIKQLLERNENLESKNNELLAKIEKMLDQLRGKLDSDFTHNRNSYRSTGSMSFSELLEGISGLQARVGSQNQELFTMCQQNDRLWHMVRVAMHDDTLKDQKIVELPGDSGRSTLLPKTPFDESFNRRN